MTSRRQRPDLYSADVWRERFGFATALALALAGAAVVVALAYDLPLRDPDGVAGPTYVRLPIILLLAFLTDVVPRAVHRSYADGGISPTLDAISSRVTRERWPLEHIRFALLGLGSWYLTYVAFRNLKSFVPFVHGGLYDNALAKIDRAIFLGHDPATVLHDLLGTSWAAHFLSFIYIAWIAMVPGDAGGGAGVVAQCQRRIVAGHGGRSRLGARRRDLLPDPDRRPDLRPARQLLRPCRTPRSPRSRRR